MKRLINILVGILLLLIIVACQKLFDNDISDKIITINAPFNGIQSENYVQTFWWSEVEGADKYNLQIVTPNFDSIVKLVLDTNVTSNQFTYTLYPSAFAWRVKAYNASYETAYTYATFSIDSTDLPITPELIGDAGNTGYIKSDSITFSWREAANAEGYYLTVYNKKTATNIISKSIPVGTTVTAPDESLGIIQVPEGDYTWTVKSSNANGNSEPATALNLFVDRTNPGTPLPQLPKIADTVGEFYLEWNRQTDAGAPMYDSLKIYQDSSSHGALIRYLKRDTTHYSETGLANNWYRYQVKTIDQADNESSWSEIRRFYFQDGYLEDSGKK